MTKEELTHVILGKQLIHDFDSKDFVDWVVTIIQQGNIKIKLIEKYKYLYL